MRCQKFLNLPVFMAFAYFLAIAMTGAQGDLISGDVGRDDKTVDMEICFLKGATIKGGSGKVEESSLDAVWFWSFLSLEYQSKSYNWNSPVANPFSPAHEPLWNTLNTIWLTVGYSNSMTRNLQYAMEADVFVSFEKEQFGLVGNDMDGTLLYALPNDWHLYGGVAVHHSPFQMDVYPLFGIMHGVESELGWTIKAGIPETKVQYRFTPRYSLGAGFAIFNVDYYLLAIDQDEDHDRYLETSDNRLFLVFNMVPRRHLNVGVGVQYTVNNELMFYNENQQNRTTYRMASVPGLLLTMQYCF